MSSVTIPWAAVPGRSAADRYEALEPGSRGVALFWVDDGARRMGSFGTPIVWGVISNRTDGWDSTSVSVSSVYALLTNRFVVRDDAFRDGTSDSAVTFSGLSMRGIASEVGWLCTSAKQGGELPVDWTYRGERHTRQPGEDASVHTRTYDAWDVANISGQSVLNNLETV